MSLTLNEASKQPEPVERSRVDPAKSREPDLPTCAWASGPRQETPNISKAVAIYSSGISGTLAASVATAAACIASVNPNAFRRARARCQKRHATK
jgi:hypothetical protein